MRLCDLWAARRDVDFNSPCLSGHLHLDTISIIRVGETTAYYFARGGPADDAVVQQQHGPPFEFGLNWRELSSNTLLTALLKGQDERTIYLRT